MRHEFDRCKEWLEDALAYANDTHDIEDIWEGIEDGVLQFWPAPNGALVTEIQVYPKRNVLHVFLGGGEMEQLLDMIPAVETYGRNMGCKSVTISGRKGWTKVLSRFGGRQLKVTMAKEL